jgi:uncharacterized protein YegL
MNATANRYKNKILVTLKAPQATKRPQLHFLFVLDTSGSMNVQRKLGNCVKSIKYALDYVQPTDYVSLITFSDKAHVVVRALAGTEENKAAIVKTLSELKADCGTNLYDALNCIQETLSYADHISTLKHGIILLTDGYPTMGDVHTDALQEVMDTIICDFPSASISTVGYGLEHNECLLQYIAQEGNGCYSVVDSLLSVAGVYGYIIGSLISCAASGLSLEVEGAEPQTAYKVSRSSAGTDTQTAYKVSRSSAGADTQLPSHIAAVAIGDICAGQTLRILLNREADSPLKLVLKGYDNDAGENICMSVEVMADEVVTEDVKRQIQVEEFRYRTYSILTSSTDTSKRRMALLAEINAFCEEDAAAAADPIILMLLDELQRFCSGIKNVSLSQNSMCVGFNRGMRLVDGSLHMDVATPVQRELSANMSRRVAPAAPRRAVGAAAFLDNAPHPLDECPWAPTVPGRPAHVVGAAAFLEIEDSPLPIRRRRLEGEALVTQPINTDIAELRRWRRCTQTQCDIKDDASNT